MKHAGEASRHLPVHAAQPHRSGQTPSTALHSFCVVVAVCKWSGRGATLGGQFEANGMNMSYLELNLFNFDAIVLMTYLLMYLIE